MPIRGSFTLFIVLLCSIFSCDRAEKVICGEPDGERKVFIDSLNKLHHNKLHVKQVPCYPSYLQVNCKMTVHDDLLKDIDSAAGELNWNEVLIYDKENNLISGDSGSMYKSRTCPEL